MWDLLMKYLCPRDFRRGEMEEKMKIAIACDHGAYEYKEMIKDMLLAQGHEVKDFQIHRLPLIIRMLHCLVHRLLPAENMNAVS